MFNGGFIGRLFMRSQFSSALLVLFAVFLLSPSVYAAQEDTPVFDTKPLLLPDTSSPRDTLHSFLTNTDEVYSDWIGGHFSIKTGRTFIRSIQTLDFSTTPNSSDWASQAERLILLREILDRIDIPAYVKIPGKDEVASNGITSWTIPDTSITISQIKSGQHAGKFLFSAETVQYVDNLYRHAKHLPYISETAIDFYKVWQDSETKSRLVDPRVRDRLKPVETTSPRSTLEGFLHSINQAYALIMNTEKAMQSSPSTLTPDEVAEAEAAAKELLHRAILALDLSNIPEALRKDIGIETALQLKEIFDRMRLPPFYSVPDMQRISDIKSRSVTNTLQEYSAFSWQYPNTEIEITEIMEGERQGEFLFSAMTIERASEFYDKVSDLPYRASLSNIDYISPDKSEGFYEYYYSTPGYLVQHAHFLGRMVDSLPGFFKQKIGGHHLWQWLGLSISLITIIILSYMSHLVIQRLAERFGTPLDKWIVILRPVLIAIIVSSIVSFIDITINITGKLQATVLSTGNVVVIAMYALVSFRVIKAAAGSIVSMPHIIEGSANASMLRLGASLTGATLAFWVFFSGVRDLGFDVVPLIAGLGVTGIAVALAARSTIENIIGSFMIYADKPLRVGQRIKVLGQDGNVESIGLRSTKIRLLNGNLTSIPNEKMASVEIENVDRRPSIRRDFNIALTYDTTPQMIKRAVDIIHDILSVPEAKKDNSEQPHPNEAINQPGFPPRVYFNDLKHDCLNILVSYWYHPAEYWDYLEHAHWINLQIMERFNAEGIEFALPTQSLHLSSDDKRSLTNDEQQAPD